jgi:uncharacterized membrane protein YbhN (UPF0104 family)
MTPTQAARTLVISIGKATITVLAIAIIIWQVDFKFLFSHARKLSALTLAICLILLASQTIVIAGLRLKLVLEALGRTRSLGETSRVALSGFFFEQVALGFVGGDAMRIWLLHRSKVPVRTALQAIVIDRCLGSISLLLLALVGLPGLMGLLTGRDWHAIVIAAAILAPIAGALAISLVPRVAKRLRTPFLVEMASLAAAAIYKPAVRRRLLAASGLAAVAQTMNVFIFFLLGWDLLMNLNLGQWFLIVPPALLISMLPISVGGWGIREACFVVALAGFGIRPDEAIIPPVIFGLGILVVTLPGGIIWLANRRGVSREADGSGILAAQATSGDTAGNGPADLPVEGDFAVTAKG